MQRYLVHRGRLSNQHEPEGQNHSYTEKKKKIIAQDNKAMHTITMTTTIDFKIMFLSETSPLHMD